VVDSSESEPRAGAAQGQGEADRTAGGESLEDAARDEREVARDRLREELGRDPATKR